MALNMDKEKWIGAALIGVLFLWVAAVDEKNQTNGNTQSKTAESALASDVTSLRGDLSSLHLKVELMDVGLNSLGNLVKESAYLDLDGKSYVSVDTDIGKLLVSVDKVSPTLNGFSFKLKIGNPNFVTFNDVDTKIYYTDADDKIQTFRTKVLPAILPGRWTAAEITVSPLTKEEVKKGIGISFEPSNIQLLR